MPRLSRVGLLTNIEGPYIYVGVFTYLYRFVAPWSLQGEWVVVCEGRVGLN